MEVNKIGLTGDEFISNLQKNKNVSDLTVIGMNEEQFTKIVKDSDTLSEIVRKLKEHNLKDFSWGWASRMSAEAVIKIREANMREQLMRNLMKDPRLQELMRATMGGGAEKQKEKKDLSKLSYIE